MVGWNAADIRACVSAAVVNLLQLGQDYIPTRLHPSTVPCHREGHMEHQPSVKGYTKLNYQHGWRHSSVLQLLLRCLSSHTCMKHSGTDRWTDGHTDTHTDSQLGTGREKSLQWHLALLVVAATPFRYGFRQKRGWLVLSWVVECRGQQGNKIEIIIYMYENVIIL